MDAAHLPALQAAVNALRADPSAIHAPSLSFFRDYLKELGATLPSPRKAGSTSSGEVKAIGSVSEWDSAVEKAGSGKMVVDFTASWCGPCKMIKPIYQDLAKEYAGKVSFFVVDVDEVRELAQKFDVSSMPTFFMLCGGKVVDEVKGANPPALKEKIAALASRAEDSSDRSVPGAGATNGQADSGTAGGGFSGTNEGENAASEEDEESEEEEMRPMPVMGDELEGDEADPDVIPEGERDSEPFPPIGNQSSDLSEADMEKQVAWKMEANDLAASGSLGEALEKWNAVIAMKPSPLTLAKRAEVLLKLKRPNAAINDCTAALKMNPDSAKSLKTRGKAYRLLGEWEKSSKDLSSGIAIDFDEDTAETQKVVQSHWLRIREKRLKHDAEMRQWTTEKEAKDRARARKRAQREYEASKSADEGRSGSMPGSMPGMGGMPGMPDLPPDIQAKMADPAVRAKLETIFSGMQGGDPSAALAQAMKHMNDPDVGPVISAVLGGMMGGGGSMPGMGGMGGMDGMGGMGGEAPPGAGTGAAQFGDDDKPSASNIEEVD